VADTNKKNEYSILDSPARNTRSSTKRAQDPNLSCSSLKEIHSESKANLSETADADVSIMSSKSISHSAFRQQTRTDSLKFGRRVMFGSP
jgi:hypothetical protein